MLQVLQSFRFLLQRMVTQQKQGLKLSVLCVLPPLFSKCHNIWKLMPQVLESANIRMSSFQLKKVFLPSLLKKDSLQTWSKCTQKAWKQKDWERELHFLKHLIISKQNVILEAWLTVFKLLRQSCKRGPYSHAGAALPALLPHTAQGGEGVGSWGPGGKANQNGHGVTLCSTTVCCATIIAQKDLLKVPHEKVLNRLQEWASHLLCCCFSGRTQLSRANSEVSSSPSAYNPSVDGCSSHSVIDSLLSFRAGTGQLHTAGDMSACHLVALLNT